MSVETARTTTLDEQSSENVSAESEQRVADALITLFRLPDEAIDTINDSAGSLHISFSEAALRSGLITEGELEQAVEWANHRNSQRRRSIIEEALRRGAASRRELVVWQGEPLAPGHELILPHEPYNERSETIRALRTELLMRTSGRRGAAIFALVSCNSRDGRSQLCAELAIAFGQLGSRTLLVDADMRKPRQHLLFGAQNHSGLAQVLQDGLPPTRLHPIKGVPQMGLLTAGPTPQNALELLSGNRFERLMSDWRRAYDYVVIDTPPASQYSDCLAIATSAGSVVLLGKKNTTTFNSLKTLQRKLQTTQAQIVGAVINAF